MFTVPCTKCGRTVKVNVQGPPRKVKVKCACGTVFVGELKPIPDAPQGPKLEGELKDLATASVARPGFHLKPRRKPVSVVSMLLLVLVAGGLIALGVGIWYIYSNPWVDEYDERTGREFHGRLPREEALARKLQAAEYNKHATARPEPTVVAPPPPAVAPWTNPDSSGGLAGELGGDPNVAVSGPGKPRQAAGGGLDFRGSIENKYSFPLQSVDVIAAAFDGEGRKIALPTVTIKYVPAKETLPFSLRVYDLKIEKVAKLGYGAQAAKPMAADEACLAVDQRDFHVWTSAGAVTLDGEAKNPLQQRLEDPEIFCDFFTDDGVWRGMIEGSLADANGIAAGEAGKFTVELKVPDGVDPNAVTQFYPRLVGKIAE